MNVQGVLKKWNDQRGFGFIATQGDGLEIFVHISSFPRDGARPQLGELLSFDIQSTADGQKRAINVRRATRRAPNASPAAPRDVRIVDRSSRKRAGVMPLVIVLLMGLGYAGFKGMETQPTRSDNLPPIPSFVPAAKPAERFICDGRQHCSQMRSHEEAVFFLQNCPDTKMDGDRDGEPCERQFNAY